MVPTGRIPSARRWVVAPLAKPARACAAFAGAAALLPAFGAPPAPATTRVVGAGFTAPLDIAALPGQPGHLIVLEQAGMLRVLNTVTAETRAAPFLDMTSLVCCDPYGGALGITFAPDFATSGHFYVLYTDSPTSDTVVTRFTVTADPFVADPASARKVIQYDRSFSGHNGGWLGFRPGDGMLYISSGDSGDGVNPDPENAAQTLTNDLRGKILRIDPSGDDFPANPDLNYAVPADNPLVGIEGDDEIWAFGLRNPWRCSFDPANGDFYIADVGQDLREELNFEAAGSAGLRNYGWRCTEGTACTGLSGCACNGSGLTPPVYEYAHLNNPCDSITGGVVYRGSAIPEFAGRYFFGDHCTSQVWSLRMIGGVATDLQEHTADLALGNGGPAAWVSTFGTDAAGEMYFAEYYAGVVHAIVPRCLADFDGNSYVNGDDFDSFAGLFEAGDPGADIDENSFVNGDDFDLFAAAFGSGC